MKKKWMLGILIGSLSVMSMPVMAQSQAILKSEILQVKVPTRDEAGTEWRNRLDAPKLRVVIKDGYKRTSEDEVIHMQLENAYWINGESTDLTPTYMEKITEDNINFKERAKDSIDCVVSIPNDLKEGEDIVIEFPLLIRVRDEAVSITISQGDKGELINTKKVFIAAGLNKRASYTIGEIPKIIEKGYIAPIKLEEIKKGRLGGQEIEVKLELMNTDLVFGDVEYINKTEYDYYTQYELKGDKYLEYREGFADSSEENILMKIEKNTPHIMTMKLKGVPSLEKGSIELKNLSIKPKEGEANEEEVLLKISSEALIPNGTQEIVGYLKNAKKEQEREEAENRLKEQEKIEDKQENSVETVEENNQECVKFTVGKNTYYVGNKICKMSAKPYKSALGEIMLPVKELAVAFGVDKKDISFSKGTVKFIYQGKMIQLTTNSRAAWIGSEYVEMQTPAESKGGQLYAPLDGISEVLGLSKWIDVRTEQVELI